MKHLFLKLLYKREVKKWNKYQLTQYVIGYNHKSVHSEPEKIIYKLVREEYSKRYENKKNHY